MGLPNPGSLPALALTPYSFFWPSVSCLGLGEWLMSPTTKHTSTPQPSLPIFLKFWSVILCSFVGHHRGPVWFQWLEGERKQRSRLCSLFRLCSLGASLRPFWVGLELFSPHRVHSIRKQLTLQAAALNSVYTWPVRTSC